MHSLFEFLSLPQMQRATVIAALAGPLGGLLGAFVTLRGMAFLSDAIAHSAMTGVALGFLLNVATDVSSPAMQVVLVVFCLAVAMLMVWMFERTGMRSDTVMAICFTGSLAVGVLLISKLRGYRVLEGALFGDILASRWSDVWVIAVITLVATAYLISNIRSLTLLTVNPDLAWLDGVSVRRSNYLFVGVTALVVALLLRYLGAMVISGLLVIPAAAGRVVSKNFRSMLIFSILLGGIGALGGVIGSYHLDLPTGPTIVVADLCLLFACVGLSGMRSGAKRQVAR